MPTIAQLALIAAVIGSLGIGAYSVLQRNLLGAVGGLVIAVIAIAVLYTQQGSEGMWSVDGFALLAALLIGLLGVLTGIGFQSYGRLIP